MKVVLFCGGQGLRLREYSENVPKPMVPIGYRPIIWHIMKYYAHFGHKEFILCLGHKADVIKEYFLQYNECMSNDFTLRDGGKSLTLANRDLDDWSLTFVDTGMEANVGQRLAAVRPYLAGEEVFMASYSDNLTDLEIPRLIQHFEEQDRTACFTSVRPSHSFHIAGVGDDTLVTSLTPAQESDLWLNGGFFIFKQSVFDYIRDGEDLVAEPFNRLIEERQLTTYRHSGFWACMDTFKELQLLEELSQKNKAPWKVWLNGENRNAS